MEHDIKEISSSDIHTWRSEDNGEQVRDLRVVRIIGVMIGRELRYSLMI